MPEQPAPGQAAYEASVAVMRDDFEGDPWRWDQLPPKHRQSWAAAHEAVAAPLREEAASLRGQLAEVREASAVLTRRNAAARQERDAARADADRLRIGGTALRARLDDLASQWEHAAPDYQGECARELREALEGGGDG